MLILNVRSTKLALSSGIIFFFACALLNGNASANQIVNGTFSSGNVGFTSGYTVVPANGSFQTGPGEISLTTNPALGLANGYNSYIDHTGDPAGIMLLVDGYYPGTNAWAETISVAPSTTYNFTGWVASADTANVAILGLFENGSQVGASFTAPSSAGLWAQWAESLTMGPGTSSVTLAIQDLNANAYTIGDDFSLDDLSLVATGTTAPEPSTMTFAALSIIGFGAVKWCRFRLLTRSAT